jgi:hypothetical protein
VDVETRRFTAVCAHAERLLSARRFSDAIRLSVECIHYISTTLGVDDARNVHSLTTIGLAYLRSGHEEKGQQYLESAVSFASQHPSVMDSSHLAITVGVAYKELGEIHLRNGRCEQAEQLLWAQCGILHRLRIDGTPLLTRIGVAKDSRGQHLQAADVYSKLTRCGHVALERAAWHQLAKALLLSSQGPGAAEAFTHVYCLADTAGDTLTASSAAVGLAFAALSTRPSASATNVQDARTALATAMRLRTGALGASHAAVLRCHVCVADLEVAAGEV